MTNYLTSAGVQQFSITIANGSLTGTATINSVGSGAFILWQGINPAEATTQFDDAQAYLTLTNSTTVTATRGATGTSKSVVINGVVIDGDTANLIKSVQFGTVTINALSNTGTAAISAVTNANTAIAYLGQDSASTINIEAHIVLSLSGTTVTATLPSAFTLSNAIKVGFCVIEFQGSALNSSVQNISRNVTGTGTSGTVSITSVTAANTILIFSGWAAATTVPNRGYQYGVLTNGTTITVNWNTSNSNNRIYNCCVVEFVSGVLAQSVQRGTTALAAASSATSNITSSAAASTPINWLGHSTSDGTGDPSTNELEITQTNATTLTVTANGTATATGSWEAPQFQPYVAPGGVVIPPDLFMQIAA